MIVQLLAILCVIGITIGQILFKISAISLAETGSFFAPKTALTIILAFALYGVTTIVWVWLLQKAELGQLYPFMALAFVLVPLGSYLLFDEKFAVQYFFGVALIMTGIFVSVSSNS